MKVPVDPNQPLKIAMFMPALNTSYLQANIKGAQDEAAKVGAYDQCLRREIRPDEPTQSDAECYPDEAVQRFFGVSDSPVRFSARSATEEAPKAGILVSAYHFSFCNTTFEAGDKQWAPGTLQYVGGSSSYPVFLNTSMKSK